MFISKIIKSQNHLFVEGDNVYIDLLTEQSTTSFVPMKKSLKL